MDNNSFFFDIYLVFIGVSLGVFLTLGILKVIPFLPALVGIILVAAGLGAVYFDKRFCCPIVINEESTIHKNSFTTQGFIDILITLLEQLPLKTFSPGQTLLFIVAMLNYTFILAVMAIQGIYNQREIFNPSDLRLAFLIISSILVGYALIYALGELLGIKLFNRSIRNNKK